jgi:hypothetical protein
MENSKLDSAHLEDTSSEEKYVAPVDAHPLPAGIDKATEKRLLAKLDKRIVPVIMWMYLMNVS